MSAYTSKIVPSFDFSAATSLPVSDRLAFSVRRARELLGESGYQEFVNYPCIPDGASEAEVQDLQSDLGVPLPADYRQFLRHCRYLKIDDGIDVWGIAADDVPGIEKPWVSREHRQGHEYLVFGNYWRYADGDQLMLDLAAPGQPVIAYLHEHGPLFDFYAPSFSLALWRLVHENEEAS